MNTTTANFSAMSTAELVAFYNECAAKLDAKPVTRFSDRAAAVRRCEKISNELIEKLAAAAEAVEPVAAEAVVVEVAPSDSDKGLMGRYGCIWCFSCGTHLSNGVSEEGQDINGKPLRHETNKRFECLACGHGFGPDVRRAARSASRSNAIALSWLDRDVAKRRAERHGVRVTYGTDVSYFKSVRKAFVYFALPLGRHIKFRGELKAMGTHSINGFRFEVL